MKLKWDSLDSLTAIGCGWGAYAVGALDGGIISSAIVGGAALLGKLGSAREKHGLNDNATFHRHRRQILDAWEGHSNNDWIVEAELEAADYLLATALLDAVPPLADLGRTVVDGKAYPQRAAAIILDRLATQHELFALPGVHGASQTARAFASTVIEAALKGALDDPDYARLLVPHMLVGIGEGVAQSIALGEEALVLLNTLVRNQAVQAGQRGVGNDKLIALAARVVENVVDQDQAAQALGSMIDELEVMRAHFAQAGIGSGVANEMQAIDRLVEQNRFSDALDFGEKSFETLRTSASMDEAGLLRLSQVNYSISKITYSPSKMAHWVLESRKIEEVSGRLAFLEVYEEALKWYDEGGASGLAIDRSVAVHLSRKALEMASARSDRVMAMNQLVIALQQHAALMTGDAAVSTLKEAIRIAQTALKTISKKWGSGIYAASLQNFAACQHSLATILSGKLAIRYLDEAVANFSEALAKFPDSILPEKRAMIQSALGIALSDRGVMQPGQVGLHDIRAGIECQREALKHLSLDREPRNWIDVNISLAAGHFKLGQIHENETGLPFLEAAVEALRTLSRTPALQAAKGLQIQVALNLGVSLVCYGTRLGGVDGNVFAREGYGMLKQLVESIRPEITVSARVDALIAMGSVDEFLGDEAKKGQRLLHWLSAERLYLQALQLLQDAPLSNHSERCNARLSHLHDKKLTNA